MKRILLSLMALLAIHTAYGQVKATSAELNAGIDDAKFATALALQGSKYLDQSGAKLYAVTAAGANTYTATIAPAITAYSAGQVFFIKITTANTGASTLNLNGLGAKALVKDAATALAGSELLANRIYALAYDGTNFQVVDVADALKANLASPAFTGVPTAPTAAAGTNTTQLATTAFVNSAVESPGALSITSSTIPQVLLNSTPADAATKNTYIGVKHYTNAEEPMFLIGGSSTSVNNVVNVGGGNANLNASTQLDFYTAADNVTATGTRRMRINAAGLVDITNNANIGGTLGVTGILTGTVGQFTTRLNVGALTGTNVNFYNNKDITGAVNSYANFTNAIIQPDVTTVAYGNRIHLGTAAATFTLPNLYYNYATQGTFGAGSTVTNQFGYYADNSIAGASTLNVGYGSNIAAGAGRWNFYVTGTAQNYFAGNVGIGTTSPGANLQVTTTADATKGVVVRGFSATQSANLQEWQTSAGTAQTVVDNAGNLGINAGANFYNVIGTEQQTIYNPAHYYSTAATTGAIVFKHATLSAATMFDIKLKFYRYNTNTALGELRISFYKPDATLINSTTGKYAYTIGNPPVELDQVRVGFDGSGNLSIILSDVATAWNTHNRVIVTEMTTSYTGGTNSAWRNGWTSAVETDLSAYTSLTALPITNMSLNGFIQNSALGQTADLRITGVGLFGGRVSAGTISNLGQLTVVPAADATKGIVVRGTATQSGNLFETQTNAGNVTYSMNPLGISSQTSTSNNSSTGRSVMAIKHESTFAGTYSGTIPVMVDLGVKTPASDQITGRISSGFNGDADRTSGYFAINTASSGTLGEAIRFNSDKSVSFNSGAALINPSGILLNLGLGNITALNNSYIQTLITGTLISRNIADANDALTVNLQNASSTGLILDAQAAGTTVSSISKAGLGTFSGLNLATVPTTSAGTYDVLTRNITTGAIEKTSSSVFTTAAANVVYAGPLTGTANPTFRKLQRNDIGEAFGAATTSGVLDWNDITNTQPGFSPTLITGASANGPGGSAYYHPFTMEHSSKTGNGNMTQIGYPYNPGAADGITWRWRYSNTWSAWRKVWDSSNFTNLNQLTTRNFSDLQGKPTTLTGYGITDGATSASVTAVQTSVTTYDNNAVHKAGTETIAGTKFFNGGVGIGLIAATVPSAYKLAVGGGIIAESVKVKPQGEWPDYVFEKGYPMLSLRELETFILKNKHLPDVPAAAEVKKEGVDLGEMDSKLLKKIEELTLYLIEMKKENEVLKERLDKLEKK